MHMGLRNLDKEQDDYPKLFKSMNEELRVARSERQRALERVILLERQSVGKAEEFHKVQIKHKELKIKLKILENPDFEVLINLI